jgi:hypothetical protein
MEIIKVAMTGDMHGLQRILSVQIGIKEGDVTATIEDVVKIIQAEIAKTLQPEIQAELRKQLPDLIAKIGPDITIAGLKQLVKEK